MKKALMIIAMVAIVAITGVLIYYYVFFRTGIEKAELRIQEQKATEETLRKENLEKCLKEAATHKKDAFNGLADLDNLSTEKMEIFLKIIQDGYENKVDACNMLYGK